MATLNLEQIERITNENWIMEKGGVMDKETIDRTKTYVSRKEAQEEVDRINNKSFDRKTFCPLAREMCRRDCVCWEKAKPYNPVTDKYYIAGYGCFNFMLFGK